VVKAVDLTDLSNMEVLCGIDIDKLPQTEYVMGEWLNTDGGTVRLQYTNGNYKLRNIYNDEVYGWVVTFIPGSYRLTV
jgi:hypothetical protein